MSQGATPPIPGSYRDPGSRVFASGGRILRGLRGDAADDFEHLERTDFYRAAIEGGRLVGTRRADAPPALAGDPPWELVLDHDVVPVISHHYEWTFSMRRDAALLQLDLAAEAVAAGMITKDATPYNVQFRGVEPVFIDIGSFEVPRRGEPWFGYRQFCRLHLYPLLIEAHLGVDPRAWLRGSLDGIVAADAWALLRRHRFARGVPTHVALPARAERRAARARASSASFERAGLGLALVAKQIAHLRRCVERTTWDPPASTWSDYADRDHYERAALAEKEAFVADAVGTGRSAVLDLGTNDGRFARLAAAGAERVIAVDADPTVVEVLYRELRREGRHDITPLVVDLVDASPAQGWRGRERSAFVERARADLVLALALVHHLAIGRSVPLDEIVELLASLGPELVVEIPDRTDPMVEVLVAQKRAGSTVAYSTAAFLDSLRTRFDVQRQQLLTGGTRTIVHAVAR